MVLKSEVRCCSEKEQVKIANLTFEEERYTCSVYMHGKMAENLERSLWYSAEQLSS